MPAPTITRPATAINTAATATAAVFRSVSPAISFGSGSATIPSGAGSYGFRIAFPSAINVSAYNYISLRIAYQSHMDRLAYPNGLSLLLYDSSGNWSRYLIAYYDLSTKPTWELFYSSLAEGYFGNTSAWRGDAVNDVYIYQSAVPDESSGTLNWSALAGAEIHVQRNTTTGNFGISTGLWSACNDESVINGDLTTPVTIKYMQDRINDPNGYYYYSTAPYQNSRTFKPVSTLWSVGQASRAYVLTNSFTFGDGSATTRFIEGDISLIIRASYLSGLDQYGAVHTGPTRRQIIFNQSASCVAQTGLFNVGGAVIDGGDYDFSVIGSANGTFSPESGSVYAAGIVDIQHGTLPDFVFNKCGEVKYSNDVTYNNCQIINNTWSGSKGLTITGAPGTYPGEFYFADNTGGNDIEITPSSAGHFLLPNVSIKSGQTLKLHNASATHAITVEIPSGITTSTSTAGGTITVVTPSVYQSVTLDGAAAGTLIQLYDTDTSTELYNGIPSSYPFTWTDSVAYAADRPIRLRAMLTGAATAKLFIDTPIGTSTNSVPALSYLVNQQDDLVYAANGINGSAVTGITIDDNNLLINVTSSTLSWATIYAYETYWLYTTAGIRDEGRIITALDQANYLFENFSIKNTGSGVITLTGGYGRDATTGSIVDIIDTSGNNIFPLPDHVVNNIVTVGGSNVITGDIADILTPIAAIPTNPLLTTDARLDHLDEDISNCLAAAAYTAPDNASIAALPTLAEIEASTVLAKEVTVASRLAEADYTAPDNASITAIKAKTDTIPASPAQAGEYSIAIAALPTLSEIEASTLAKEATVAALNDISVGDILVAASTTPIAANVKEVNDITIIGIGKEPDPWGPI